MSESNYYQESIEKSVSNQGSLKEEKKNKNQLHKTALEFEKSIIDIKDARIKMLTKGLTASLIITVLLALSLAILMPLKTAVPYLLRVDNTTGFVDKLEPYNAKKSTVNEAVVRYFIAKYVVNRESYDWFTIQSMYDFIEETSSPNIFASYKGYFASEYSPLKKLGKKMKQITTVNTISFLNPTTVQVRFTKSFEENDGKEVKNLPRTTWLATMSFDFSKNVRTEKQRLINPLGFAVTSYKLDAEVK